MLQIKVIVLSLQHRIIDDRIRTVNPAYDIRIDCLKRLKIHYQWRFFGKSVFGIQRIFPGWGAIPAIGTGFLAPVRNIRKNQACILFCRLAVKVPPAAPKKIISRIPMNSRLFPFPIALSKLLFPVILSFLQAVFCSRSFLCFYASSSRSRRRLASIFSMTPQAATQRAYNFPNVLVHKAIRLPSTGI